MFETRFLILLTVAAIASAWANIQIGPRIGWNRGGLPVVILVFFVALIVYVLTALVISGAVNGGVGPGMIYSPFSP